MKSLFISIPFLTAAVGSGHAGLTSPSSTLDGGGGKSTGVAAGGKTYTVTGTIGQFDASAAPVSGGAHKFIGGFWAQVVAGSLPDRPVLTLIRFPSGDASVQWQADASGWQVETSYDLVHWSNLSEIITGSGTLTMTANPAVTKQFFRLRKP